MKNCCSPVLEPPVGVEPTTCRLQGQTAQTPCCPATSHLSEERTADKRIAFTGSYHAPPDPARPARRHRPGLGTRPPAATVSQPSDPLRTRSCGFANAPGWGVGLESLLHPLSNGRGCGEDEGPWLAVPVRDDDKADLACGRQQSAQVHGVCADTVSCGVNVDAHAAGDIAAHEQSLADALRRVRPHSAPGSVRSASTRHRSRRQRAPAARHHPG